MKLYRLRRYRMLIFDAWPRYEIRISWLRISVHWGADVNEECEPEWKKSWRIG